MIRKYDVYSVTMTLWMHDVIRKIDFSLIVDFYKNWIIFYRLIYFIFLKWVSTKYVQSHCIECMNCEYLVYFGPNKIKKKL